VKSKRGNFIQQFKKRLLLLRIKINLVFLAFYYKTVTTPIALPHV